MKRGELIFRQVSRGSDTVGKEGDKELEMEQNDATTCAVILCVFVCTDFALVLFAYTVCLRAVRVCFLSVRFACVRGYVNTSHVYV